MRLRRKRLEAAVRQGQDGADAGGLSAALDSPGREGLAGHLARLGDAFARRLASLTPREQSGVAIGTAVLLVALVVGVGVLPAWRSLQQGPARQQALNAQVARVAQLEAQAKTLKARPAWSRSEAAAKLQASSLGLAAPVTPGTGGGSAVEQLQLSLTPQQAQATLRALPADTLAAWLAAAREQAHAVPSEARLTREAGAEGGGRWSGTVVMRLPP